MSETKTHLEETVQSLELVLVWLVGYLGIPEDKVRAGVAAMAKTERQREETLVEQLASEIGAILDPIVEADEDAPGFKASLEFHCPKCGGSNYRTDGMGMTTGYCEGTGDADHSWPCKFQWERADDWQVFQLVQARRFASLEDYNRTYKALHP